VKNLKPTQKYLSVMRELLNPFQSPPKSNPDDIGAIGLVLGAEMAQAFRARARGNRRGNSAPATTEPPADFSGVDIVDEETKQALEQAKEQAKELKETKKLFGENFFGSNQIESAFTIQNEHGQDIKLINLTPAERQQAEQMLKEKLREPDIKQFLSNPENQKDIKDGKYLLIAKTSH
jgi:hypothetical protein